jgi:hypothetical protein
VRRIGRPVAALVDLGSARAHRRLVPATAARIIAAALVARTL